MPDFMEVCIKVSELEKKICALESLLEKLATAVSRLADEKYKPLSKEVPQVGLC